MGSRLPEWGRPTRWSPGGSPSQTPSRRQAPDAGCSPHPSRNQLVRYSTNCPSQLNLWMPSPTSFIFTIHSKRINDITFQFSWPNAISTPQPPPQPGLRRYLWYHGPLCLPEGVSELGLELAQSGELIKAELALLRLTLQLVGLQL